MADAITQLAESVVDAGVDLAFGVSGSGPSYQFIGALMARGVRYVPVSHEAVAPVAAGAYGWLTGRRAAAISIKGPGFANMMAGMCSAYFEGYAPICIAENYDDAVPPERMHKRLDQHAIVASIAGGIHSLCDLDEVARVLGEPGRRTRPLYIELSRTRAKGLWPEQPAGLLETDSDVGERIAAAKRPVLIAGSLARRTSWEPLIDRLRIPVFTTTQAKGLVDERKPNAAGIYTGVGKALAPETTLLPLADLVVTVGLRNMEILGVAGKAGFLNFDVPHPLSTSHDMTVPETVIRRVLDALSTKPAWGTQELEGHRRRWQEYVGSYAWMPGQVFAALDAQTDPHVLVLDTGTFCTVGEHVWHAGPGRDFLGSSNGRNLGIGVPHALGAAHARPGTPVFCVVGDGGIRYYLSDIRTIAELGLPVCVILMKDGQYGSIAANVPGQPADRRIVEPLGTSWTGVMNAMGLPGGSADSAGGFQRLLDRWDRKTPWFIEATFDADTYLHVADAIRG